MPALTVLLAFAIRADSLPPNGHRVARPRYNVNRAGQGIEDPGVTDRRLALAADPQLEWESFDEYWRKVHGPKILHQDGASDEQTQLLCYYLQQHRVPGGPSSGFAPPYRPPLGADGRLSANPVEQLQPHRRPAWDGLAQLGYRNKDELYRFFSAAPGKYADKIMPDEALFIRGFAFNLAEEHIVLTSATWRRDPLVLLTLHIRNPELTRAQFRGRWMAQHAELMRETAASIGGLRRYAQLVNVSEPDDQVYDALGDRFDGVGALSFASMNDVEDYLASDIYRRIRDDEIQFAADSQFFTTLNYVIKEHRA